jgi:asparagine synthase (glutamine-hydrolysing)
MCGITGYWSEREYAPDVLERMTRAIAHRGPDAEGFYVAGRIRLGHRRLSIIDLAGSAQPLFNEDGAVVVAFNGEIYNFRELRRELLAAGHRFHTGGDTEVLVHAWEEWGEGMLDRIAGMFAFAIWDERRQALFLARDHLGVKPLYYYWDGSVFAFGSELKALAEHPAVRREPDLAAIALYLECQYIPAPRSIYRDVKKLEAGHSLLLANGELQRRRYWVPDYSRKIALDDAEAVVLVERELRRSVESMLVADVPLGAFVSGGIDSSLVAALMTDVSGKPIETFNLSFAGDALESERVEAEITAKHIGSRHHSLVIDPATVLDAVGSWVEVFDEPFGDQASLPTLLLARLTRRSVTVVLTGEGADEIFAGYENYAKRVREERLVSVLARRGSPLPGVARRLPPLLRKDRIVKAVGQPLAERYVTIPNIFDESLRATLLAASFERMATERMREYAARYYEECNSADYMDRIMYVDARLWLPDDLLTKVDRATMASSLEARVPYLDHRFFELCARLDTGLKQRGSTGKYVLKKIAERYLPAKIVHRDKQGFIVPLGEWFTGELGPLVADCLSAAGLGKRGIFAPGALERLLAQHRSGRKNHAMRLWVLVVLELWFRRYAPGFAL